MKTSTDLRADLLRVIALAEKVNLFTVCDPECEGRCKACPADLVSAVRNLPLDALLAAVEENKLLADVLSQARETLYISIKGTPEELQSSLGKLALICKRHWDWQTERIAAQGRKP